MEALILPPSLVGHLLIATPALRHPLFRRAVVLVCAHSSGGAMGFVLNRPATGHSLRDLLRQRGHVSDGPARDRPLHFGGPFERRRCFVLHGPGLPGDSGTMHAGEAFRLSSSEDVLTALARRRGLSPGLVLLGYAGWKAGQLQAELADNTWFTAPATEDLVFAGDPEATWGRALGRIGIPAGALSGLSAQHGHA
jgi:putative transcriptional regulator